MRYGGRREIKIAAGALAVVAIQIVWYYAVVLTMHMLYYDRPVQKTLGFGVLVHTVAFLPLIVTVVTAAVVGVTRLRRGGRRPE
jgi:hypothetical protein